MSTQLIVTTTLGTFFFLILLAIGLYLTIREDRPVPDMAMWIFRVILSLAGAAFAAVLPGFLEIQAKYADIAVRAGGALAVFFILYKTDPPDKYRKQLVGPKKPVKHPIQNADGRKDI